VDSTSAPATLTVPPVGQGDGSRVVGALVNGLGPHRPSAPQAPPHRNNGVRPSCPPGRLREAAQSCEREHKPQSTESGSIRWPGWDIPFRRDKRPPLRQAPHKRPAAAGDSWRLAGPVLLLGALSTVCLDTRQLHEPSRPLVERRCSSACPAAFSSCSCHERRPLVRLCSQAPSTRDQ